MTPKTWRQCCAQFDQLLVLAAQRATAAALGAMLRGFGPHGAISWTGSAAQAHGLVQRLAPQLIFVERAGAEFDGLAFVRSLRRSGHGSRDTPVILMSDERTVAALRDAQNAGVHEFLVKPFSAAHLLKRLDVICGEPRTWIETASYTGPDRRRFNSADVPAAMDRRRRTSAPKSG